MADVSQKVFEKKENCRIPATHLAHILAWFCEARIKKNCDSLLLTAVHFVLKSYLANE
jgi:hypothetical protein